MDSIKSLGSVFSGIMYKLGKLVAKKFSSQKFLRTFRLAKAKGIGEIKLEKKVQVTSRHNLPTPIKCLGGETKKKNKYGDLTFLGECRPHYRRNLIISQTA